jgi:predicted CXXCH cytochrome family protein
MDNVRLLTSLVLLSTIILSPGRNGSAAAADQCLACHQSLGERPSSLFKHDVHFEKGISCADCHGGNPKAAEMEKAMDTTAGFLKVPKGDAISRTCARCHADSARMKDFGSSLPTNQWALLQRSVHGGLATSGAEHIAQCTSCHGAHGIFPKTNPRSSVYPLNVVKTCTGCHANAALMRTYNPSLAVDQLEKYRTSVHGMRNAKGDIKTAECASCHGSHGILPPTDVNSRVYRANIPNTCAGCHSNAAYMKGYNIPTDQAERFERSVHGVALLQKGDPGAPSCNSCHGNHGAVPPGVESISNVCGTCHALNAELFSSSPHKKAFDEQHLPECETCHENHEIKPATAAMLGGAEDAVCSQCHSPSDASGAYHSAVVMRSMVDSLKSGEDSARALVNEAEQRGMEVGDAKFKLRSVRQAWLESRTVVHSFDVNRFQKVADQGLAAALEVRREAGDAIGEYYYRRIGLGIATLILTVLAVALYLYIRRLERKPHPTSGPGRPPG